MPSPIEIVNKRRVAGGRFSDNLGHLPISKNHCRMIVNIEEFNISEVIITHERENKFAEENNIRVVDSNGKKLHQEDRLNVRGILFRPLNGEYTGCYYHNEIKAWLTTYSGENQETVRELHDAYVEGYQRALIAANASDDELKENPRPAIHDLDSV